MFLNKAVSLFKSGSTKSYSKCIKKLDLRFLGSLYSILKIKAVLSHTQFKKIQNMLSYLNYSEIF